MAVADELRGRGAEVSFLGTASRIEADLVPAAGYELDFLDVRGINRRNPLKAAIAAGKAATAVHAARRVLGDRDADVVMGGGGFVAGPAGLAAISRRIPLVLTEADSHLGLANRLLARRAQRVCLAFPIEGRNGDPYLVTGRAIPAAVLAAGRAAARQRFGIAEADQALLVMGGSQGARTINQCALDAFTGAAADRDFHVVHLAGRRDHPELAELLRESDGADRYTLLEYEPNLGDCLAACDLVIGRSGGSIFEVAATGRPAILIPYPFATGDHQTSNARWMADAGAATVLADADLTPQGLASEVRSILGDPARLDAMSQASLALASPGAASAIACQVLEAAAAAGPGGGR